MAKAIYQLLQEKIVDDIKDKPYNTPIESERDLAKKFKVSRMTVRKAIEALVEQGYLYRDKNKGTFIADTKLHKKNTAILGLSNIEKANYKILYYDVKEAGEEVSNHLEIDENDKVLKVIRLFLKNDKPAYIEEVSLNMSNIESGKLDPTKDLEIIENYLGNGKVTQTFKAMLVPIQYANLLKLKINTPIIMVENLIRSINGMPLLFAKVYNNPLVRVIEITM